MTETAAATVASEQRIIRFFVSSTFQDMQADRDELVKHVFPRLRKLCESRGATWGEVDLRWGIPDEEKAEGKVLPVCLAEIRGCRPYFLGLLGERYGWVPEEIDPALIEQEPWLEEHREKSVTELEILHGVLNDPAMADHAFFYLRDPVYAEGKPALQEGPTEDEIAKHGADEAERRAEERRKKLRALKTRIRESGLPPHDDYPDPRVLGELVLEDLTEVIDRLFPEGTEPEPLDREAAEHEAFAQSRARVYIGRREYFERLDAHASGDGPPLVVLGESGAGKSALLANWALRHRAAHGPDLVLMHFVGASANSADWAAMVRRILGELGRRFELHLEAPDQPDALRTTFANALQIAAERGRVVLVLDALNQLEDRDAAPDLIWLPPELPANVRLIVSTLEGRPLDELRRRGWPTLEVELLEPDERKRLVVEYLAQQRRKLSPERVQQIAAADQTANPLYLRALVDELRVWGEYETLAERIDHYLRAPTVADLYEKILERYEGDYERDRPGLVREAMSLLWASRRGLSQAELLDLLGRNDDPLPGALWSPLYLAVEQSLLSRSGLIGFAHHYLSRAIEERYLPAAEDRRAAHLRLAEYFGRRELGVHSIDELPWQLRKAEDWRRLYDVLAGREFLGSLAGRTLLEAQESWVLIERHSPLRMIDAYRPENVMAALGPGPVDPQTAVYVEAAIHLLTSVGHYDEALLLGSQVAAGGDAWNTPSTHNLLAEVHIKRGNLDEAWELLETAEPLCRWLHPDPGWLLTTLGNKSIVLQLRHDFDEAAEVLDEAESICRELHSTGQHPRARHQLANVICEQGNVLAAQDDLDGALAKYKEEELIRREVGDQRGLALSLGNQALAVFKQGDLARAMELHVEEKAIYTALGDRDGLRRSVGNQSLVHRFRGDFEQALTLLKRAELLSRELDMPTAVVRALGEQAVVLALTGRRDEALQLADEAHVIAVEHGDAASANFLAHIRARIPHQQAMPLASSPVGLVDPVAFARLTRGATPGASPPAVDPPTPHPRADPQRASRLNREYLEELARWEALPWWKRRTMKRPVRPTGI